MHPMSDKSDIQNLNWKRAAGPISQAFEYLKAKFPNNPEIQELYKQNRFITSDEHQIGYIGKLHTPALLKELKSRYAGLLYGIEDLLEYDIEQDTYNPAGGGFGYIDSELAENIYHGLQALSFFADPENIDQNQPVFKVVHSYMRNRSGSISFAKALRENVTYRYEISYAYPEDRFSAEANFNESLISTFCKLAERQNKQEQIRFCFNDYSHMTNAGKITIVTRVPMQDLIMRLYTEENVQAFKCAYTGKAEELKCANQTNGAEVGMPKRKSAQLKATPLKLRRRPGNGQKP